MPVKVLWNPHVPIEVGFFAWGAWWGKNLTMIQLKKRGYSFASRCPLCGLEEEVLEHLFIHCLKIWCLWKALYSFFRRLGLSFFG